MVYNFLIKERQMAELRPIIDAQGKNEQPMRYFQIFLDGIDKTGKDLIRSYIFYLGKGRYICVARGIASMRVYSQLYDRPYLYDDASQQNVMNVLLTVDKEDWVIRCKTSNEPLTDYDKETQMFNEVFDDLERKGYNVLRYNTSTFTPYTIAKMIVNHMEKLNGLQQND